MSRSRPLRIAMVIQSYLPRLGGAEKQLSAVCSSLRKRGYEPLVITRRYKGMTGFEIINGTPVYRVFAPKPKPIASLCFLIFGFFRVLKLKPDLIHAYELLSPTDLSITAKRWLKVPLVVKVLRGGWMGDIYKLHHRGSGNARLKRLENVDAFIAISQEIRGELIGEGIDKHRCRYIPNGVDISIYEPADLTRKMKIRKMLNLPRGFLLLFCGRLVSEKGLDWLFPVWNQFNSGKSSTLVLVGSGEEEKKLKATANDTIQFKGSVADPLLYYQSADAFILPSNTEGLSNSLLEAMACELPVIAVNVGGAPEVITHDLTGFLVEPGDSQGLLDSLNFLFTNSKDRLRIGANARKKILESFPLEKTVSALESLYSELLNKKGNQ